MPIELIERTYDFSDFDIKRSRTGRTVTAYAAVFDQETEIRDVHGHYVEMLSRSCFNRTLSHGIGKVSVFYNHGYDLSGKPNMLGAVPIATPEEIRPDGKGLLTISRYNDGELADAVLAAWEGGQIRGQSFRGRVFQSKKAARRGSLPLIERTELGLKEYGPTHSPAYEGAGLVAIRSQEELSELVRSMIQGMTGTHTAPPAIDATSTPDLGAPVEDSPDDGTLPGHVASAYSPSGEAQGIWESHGMAKRRKSTEIESDLEILRSTILEVEDADDPTEEDLERAEAALEEIPDLEAELARSVEREDEIERLRDLAASGATEPGDQRPSEIQRRRAPEVKRNVDPFEILRGNSHHMDEPELVRSLRDANLKAMENASMPDGYTGSFETFINRHRADVSWAKNMLARQRPEYAEAWEKAMTGQVALLTDVERAAIAVGTNTAGGFLVPTHLDPTLILTNSGVSNVIRGMARVVTLTGGANKWNGVTTAGSTASWDAELTEVSDDTPPVAPVQIPVFSAKSLIMASIESFEDISNLASEVQMMLMDSKDRLEATAHAVGTGSGMPTGIVPALTGNGAVTVSLATGATITLADLQNIYRLLPIRWRGKGTWLSNPLFHGSIQALGTALSASYSTDLTQPYTERLIGRPYIESDEMPSLQQTTTIDPILVFGDFSNYVIVDKPGSTSVEFIPHLFNVSNNLPDGRRGWYMHFRGGADSVNDLAFRLLVDKTTA